MIRTYLIVPAPLVWMAFNEKLLKRAAVSLLFKGSNCPPEYILYAKGNQLSSLNFRIASASRAQYTRNLSRPTLS
jgi:hypothetical protein